MTPEQFLAARFDALRQRNFQAVYESFHIDSPFRQQFLKGEDYTQFAEQQLQQVKVNNWHIVDQRHLDRDRLECLLVMEIQLGKSTQFFYECALLLLVDGHWCYHSAQKLGADDYSGPPDQIRFTHFDQMTEKIRF